MFATFDGHRNDDFAAYVYVSEDYGQRWKSLTEGLPQSSVNAFAEHPRTPNLLFVGNEVGVYFSVDRGEQWVRLKNNLPTVPVDDIVVHPRENDLVLGTHGRGIWIMADITPLEQLSPQVLASAAHLFSVRRATAFNEHRPQGWTPSAYAADEPESGALIRYYLREDLAEQEMISTETMGNGGSSAQSVGDGEGGGGGGGGSGDATAAAKVTILDARGETIRELEGAGTAGVQQVVWDLRYEPPYEPEQGQGGGGGGGFRGPPRGPMVMPGTYTARLDAAGRSLTPEVLVRGDPRITISDTDREARQRALMSAYALAKPAYEAGRAVRRLTDQLRSIERLLQDTEEAGAGAGAPAELAEEVDSLQAQLEELNQDIGRAGGGRVGNSIEGSTSRPTADQIWQLEQAWELLPTLLDQLNQIIDREMPALYDRLNEHGIRPDPGDPIPVPRRPGR